VEAEVRRQPVRQPQLRADVVERQVLLKPLAVEQLRPPRR
jgi:hypothetical protein